MYNIITKQITNVQILLIFWSSNAKSGLCLGFSHPSVFGFPGQPELIRIWDYSFKFLPLTVHVQCCVGREEWSLYQPLCLKRCSVHVDVFIVLAQSTLFSHLLSHPIRSTSESPSSAATYHKSFFSISSHHLSKFLPC